VDNEEEEKVVEVLILAKPCTKGGGKCSSSLQKLVGKVVESAIPCAYFKRYNGLSNLRIKQE
jgi:hypothetical protein